MFKTWYVFLGFVVGMIIASVFVPPTSNLKMLPNPNEPNRVFKNPKVENGFFQIKCIEVPCTAETDSLNLMSAIHNTK